MNEIFDSVYRTLKWLAKITGLTYEEINVSIWFIAIPGIFMFLIDRILKSHYLKIGFGIAVLFLFTTVSDFENFSKTIFKDAASFLHWFDFLGINYIQASVLICVLLPISIVGILIVILRKRKKSQ